MDTISLSLVCPRIFQTQTPQTSDVWNNEVRFEKGKTYLVEAAPGTGKSSLCSYLCGYRDDYQGDILFDGKNIRQLSINDWSDIRSRQLSYLVQDLRLFSDLTAFENIEIKNQMTHHKSAEQIMEWLSQLGIADKRDVPVKYISFGQQQRVALVRSLSLLISYWPTNPSIIWTTIMPCECAIFFYPRHNATRPASSSQVLVNI